MIKAVATALVLIAGAAVVLWFGNTLNSWVLGGLIGGLAALLLSIPISLTLFSYLSRRHDEQLRAEAEQAVAELEMYEYEQLPARTARAGYEIEEYAEVEEEEFWDEDEQYYQQRRQQVRSRPQPTPQRYLEPSPATNRQPASRRGTYGPLPKPGTRNVPAARGKDVGSRRPTTRNMSYPGMPGYETGSMLSQQKAAALRAARMEKRQQDEDDVEVLPTHISRRLPSMRPEQDMTGQYEQLPRPRSSQHLSPETPQTQRRRPRVVESKPSRHDIPRSLPPAGVSSLRQSPYMDDPETDTLNDFYPETGPMRRSTGQFARNPRLDSTRSQTENPSGTLGKPLVRRAPYMYEDDPLREELSQQIYPPRVRRSSRLEPQRDDQE
jgi:hypothetical protein